MTRGCQTTAVKIRDVMLPTTRRRDAPGRESQLRPYKDVGAG